MSFCYFHREEPEQNVELNALTIENKYYSAKLALQAVGFGSNEDTSIFDNAEGYILVPDASDVSRPNASTFNPL